MCDSVLLAEANTDSMSLLDRRDGRDFSVAFCSSGGGDKHSQGDIFSTLKKPLHKPRYSSVSALPCSLPVPFLSLSAGARLDGHVGVNLEHPVRGLVLIEHGQGTHLLRHAAGLGDAGDDADGSDDALNGGVVGGPGHLGVIRTGEERSE